MADTNRKAKRLTDAYNSGYYAGDKVILVSWFFSTDPNNDDVVDTYQGLRIFDLRTLFKVAVSEKDVCGLHTDGKYHGYGYHGHQSRQPGDQ